MEHIVSNIYRLLQLHAQLMTCNHSPIQKSKNQILLHQKKSNNVAQKKVQKSNNQKSTNCHVNKRCLLEYAMLFIAGRITFPYRAVFFVQPRKSHRQCNSSLLERRLENRRSTVGNRTQSGNINKLFTS